MGKLNGVEAVNLGTRICEVSKGRVHYRAGKIGDLEINGCCKASGTNGTCNCNLLHGDCQIGAVPLERYANIMRGDID